MRHRTPALVPLVLVALTILATVAFDWQLTAERYVGSDLVYREAQASPLAYPVMDPSPWSIAVPTDRWLHASLRAGALPLWDETQTGGYSPATQGNVGVFFPLRWLTVVVPVAQAPTALALMSVALAYLGYFLLCTALGLNRWAGVLSGLTYAFSSVFLVQLLYDGGAVMLFFPWLAWADVRLAESPTLGRFTTAAMLFAAAFLSGHIMVLFVVFLAVTLFHAFRVPSVGMWHTGRFGAASVCGLALAAFAMLPMVIELQSLWLYKLEAAQGESFTTFSWSSWLRASIATTLDASTATTPLDTPPFYFFLGPVVVALTIGGFALATGSSRLRPTAVFAVVAFAIAVPGPWMAPLAALPPLRWVRTFYAATLLIAAAALMVGVAVDRLAHSPHLARYRAPLLIILILAGPGLTLVRTAVVTPPTATFALPDTGASRFLDANATGYKLSASWGQVHLPHLAPWSGYHDVRTILVGFDRRLHLWWELVDPDVMSHSYPTTRMTPSPASPLLPMFGVRWFLEGKFPHTAYMTATGPRDRFAQFAPRPSTPGFDIAYEDLGLRIYHLPDARPEAYIAANVTTVPDLHSAAAWIRDNPGQLASATLVESAIELPPNDAAGTFEAPGTSVVIERATGARVDISTQASTDALLVLNHRYDAGWSAFVDGNPVPILPANVVARAVVIPPGEHRLTMRYTPPGMREGSIISVFTLGGLLGALCWQRRRKRPPSEPNRELPTTF